MFIFLALLTSLSALAMLLAGSLSFLRNPQKSLNQWFFFLSLVLAFWVPANFIDSNVARAGITNFFVKVDFSLAIFIGWSMLQFINAFVSRVTPQRTDFSLARSSSFRTSTLVLNFALIVAIFGNQIIEATIKSGNLVVSNKSGYLLYVVPLLFYMVYALIMLFVRYLRSKDGERRTYNLILLGFFFAALANVLTNIVFPSVIHTRSVVKELNIIGYFGILLLVLCTYVAITTQKLFDIRFVVTKSLAYVLLIGAVGGIYTGVVTLISLLFLPGTSIKPTLILTNLTATFFVAITFQYLRRFFNRITDRLFYRDNYDIQDVLNQLSRITTSTLEIDILLRHTASLFDQALKSSFCCFVLVDEKRNFKRVFGNPRDPEGFKTLAKSILGTVKAHNLIIVDYLEIGDPLKKILNDLEVEVVIPLFANKALVGLLILGTKHNGVVYTKQDIRLLTIAGDSLSVAVQNALRFEEIEKFNITLQEKVDDATHRLRKINEKLKALDETKDEFISMASHQLRTPLTSVKGYVSMVMEGDAGKLNDMQHKLLNQAFISSQRMVYLISDLLNVSRLKTGKFVIEPKPTNLAQVIDGEISQLVETAKSRKLELTYNKPPHFPVLNIDEMKIRQVIMNFVDNAIYYTPAGGHIAVDLIDKPDSIECTVVDDGIGVPQHERHHLFTKFYRAGNARKARPDGTGLGLFMAQKVVIAQGGSIIFQSQEGKGSTFGFSLPKARLLVASSPTELAVKNA